MPAKYSRHVALTGPLVEWAERQVAEGEYNSVSDLIRTAIRVLKDQDEGRRKNSAPACKQQQPPA